MGFTGILLLPFCVFYWLVPVFSNITIGNDYSGYSLNQQIELMFSLKMSTFPLFVSGFEGGHSAAALTLGQIWHPIARLAEISPGYWNGHALDWGTFYRLVSLGAAQALLFTLLRFASIPPAIAFLLSFITVYNFRMLDQFRYGAGLEAYTGCIFFIVASGYKYLKSSGPIGIAWIALATYWLVTSGHPQFAYLCLVSALVSATLLPFVFGATLRWHSPLTSGYLNYVASVILGVLVGIGLSACYWLPFLVEVLGTNTQRVGQNYDWSLGYSESLLGLMNSFFFPLATDVHSNFGGSSIFLLALTSVLGIFAGRVVPKVIWLMWWIVVVTFIVSLGDFSFLHYLFWKIFPFADSMRVPGRVNVLLPPMMMLILIWLFHSPEFNQDRRGLVSSRIAQTVVALVYLAVYLGYFSFLIESEIRTDKFTPQEINAPLSQWTVYSTVLLGALTLVLCLLWSAPFTKKNKTERRKKWVGKLGFTICFLAVLHVAGQMRYGTWLMWPNVVMSLEQIKDEKKQSVDYLFPLPDNITYGLKNTDVEEFEKYAKSKPQLANFLYCETMVENNEVAYEILDEALEQECAVLIDKSGARKSTLGYQGKRDVRIDLVFNTTNRYDFTVSSTAPGWFVLGLPFSAGSWIVRVNESDTSATRVNGNLVGVRVEPGQHVVSFRFGSKATRLGFVFSALCGVVLAFLVCWRGWRGRRRISGSTALLIGVLFIQWGLLFSSYRSFDGGESLETQFDMAHSFSNLNVS